VADRSRSQASALQGAVCQGEVEMVANRWREQRLNPGEGFCRYIEPMLVAGGVQRKMVDRVQVFPQVGNEGQGMREGPKVIDALEIAGRDECGETVWDGLESGCEVLEMTLEIGDQAGQHGAQAEDPICFLADL